MLNKYIKTKKLCRDWESYHLSDRAYWNEREHIRDVILIVLGASPDIWLGISIAACG